MTNRPALIGWCAFAVAWMTAGTVYLYPGLKEEVDEKRYIHRPRSCTRPSCRWNVGEPVGSKTATSFERTSTRKGAG
jgi:hypothetical protein